MPFSEGSCFGVQISGTYSTRGGVLDGKKYLNSLEAVQQSITNGLKYIELDLLETTDNDLVAAHDWRRFHTLTGSHGETKPISSQEAQSRKILEKQTVLTSQEIKDIFENNPNLILVTDKIQNIDLIVNKFSSFLDRLIVEVFSIEKYREVKQKGIQFPAFCVWDSKERYDTAKTEGVAMITLLANNLDNHLPWFQKNRNIVVFAFSTEGDEKANSITEIKKYAPFITGWYTDFLKPENFE